MKKLLALAVVFLAIFSPVPGGDKKEETKHLTQDGTLFNMDHLNKTWGIKLKSVKVTKEDGGTGLTQFTAVLLLEFSKDVEDVKAMQKAFVGPNPPTLFFFFDKESVVISKLNKYGTEGELTGTKGDAFRIHLNLSLPKVQTVAKVEARSFEPKDEPKIDPKKKLKPR